MTSSKKVSLKPCKYVTKTDRISNLPDVIIDQILSYLPIKERARTSFLSRKWRYKWANNPILAFNNHSLPLLNNEIHQYPKVYELVSEIDCILLVHVGPITKFELSYPNHLPTNDIHKWMIHVSRHNVTELVLKFCKTRLFKLPSCVFSMMSLTCLELASCSLKPPSTFGGFKNLKSLSLDAVKVHPDVLAKFVSSCPLLEKLNLVYNERAGTDILIDISAPNLQCFGFQGPFVDFSLKDTSRIKEFSMDVSFRNIDRRNKFFNLIKLLAAIPLIEELALEEASLAYLPEDFVVPRALPVSCVNLWYLSICVDLTSFKDTSVLFCLLRSAPNLQELYIELTYDKIWEINGNYWETDQLNHPFTCLRYIEIGDCCGEQCEIDFIKFMLLTSPALMKMIITVGDAIDINRLDCTRDKWKLDLTKQLLCLKRASAQAQIIFNDP